MQVIVGEKFEFGKVIKAAREKKKWSQLALSSEVGIVQSTLSKYERGVLSIPTEIAQKLFGALGLQMKITSKKEVV
jgi:transcriptional regulator with XRE-family HTH domain